jgi:hypothetical protein
VRDAIAKRRQIAESLSEPGKLIRFGEHGLVVACARCGGTAAELELVRTGAEPDELLGDCDRLVRRGFIGGAAYARDLQSLLTLYGAIALGDFRRAHDLEPDALGFYCPDCDAAYCERCWDVGPPEFDDEWPDFYDCTHATCPAGHAQIVDD